MAFSDSDLANFMVSSLALEAHFLPAYGKMYISSRVVMLFQVYNFTCAAASA